MAEGHRMTAAQVADKLLAASTLMCCASSVAWMVARADGGRGRRADRRRAWRAPPSAASPAQRLPAARWDTRVGELELAIPRLRTGRYFPSFLEPRRRAEQALVAVVQEAYVNGVSTRKVDRLVEQLGLQG